MVAAASPSLIAEKEASGHVVKKAKRPCQDARVARGQGLLPAGSGGLEPLVKNPVNEPPWKPSLQLK